MIRISQVARRYAHVLLTLAHEENQKEVVHGDLKKITNLVNGHTALKAAFSSPLISRADAKRVLSKLGEKLSLHSLSSNFLNVLAEKRRLAILCSMEAAYGEELNKMRGQSVAHVSTPFPLSKEQLARLSKILGQKSGHAITIETEVDKSLLGGIVIRVGSCMIDASLKAKMMKLKHNLERVA